MGAAPEISQNSYYVEIQGKAQGPYSVEEVRWLLYNHHIQESSLVWCEGMADWAPLSSQPVLREFGPSAAPALVAGRDSLPGAALAIDRYTQGGFLKRLAAFMIDWMILTAAFAVAGVIAETIPAFKDIGSDDIALTALGTWALICGRWLYHASFESSSLQASPGKLALGLRACDETGERLSFLHASGRYFAKLLSLPFFAGFIAIAFSARKQGFHDMVCRTYVVERTKTLEPQEKPVKING